VPPSQQVAGIGPVICLLRMRYSRQAEITHDNVS
jgi:hypothetical protein